MIAISQTTFSIQFPSIDIACVFIQMSLKLAPKGLVINNARFDESNPPNVRQDYITIK